MFEKLNVVHIYPTNKCQLNCEYCLHDKNDEMMTIEIADKIIDYINSIDCKAIAFYGGEPLLNFPVVKRFIDNINDKVAIGIPTNGIALEGEIAEFLASAKNVTVSISIDPQMQYRTDKYTDIILKNARSFIKRRHTYNGFVEVNSVINSEEGQVYYNEEFQNYLLNDIGFDYVNCTCIGTQSLNEISNEIQEWLLKGYRPPNIAILEYVKVHMKEKEHFSDCFICEAGKKQITFVSDGSIYSCYKFYNFRKFKIGHIDTGIDYEGLKEWNDDRAKRIKMCKDCENINLCKGGCSYQHYVISNKEHTNAESFCEYRNHFINSGKKVYDNVINKGSLLNISLVDSKRLSSGYGKRYFIMDTHCSDDKKYNYDKEIFIPNKDEFNIYPGKDGTYTLYIYKTYQMYSISTDVAAILEISCNDGMDKTINYLMRKHEIPANESQQIVMDVLARIKCLFEIV